MRGFLFISSVCTGLLACAHLSYSEAADLYDPYQNRSFKDAPIETFRYSWTGLYLGVHGSYAFGDSSSRNRVGRGTGDGFDDGFVGTEVDVEPDGFSGGIQIGYNQQEDRLVLGLEAEGGYFSVDDLTFGENFADVEYGFYGAFTGRIGYAQDRYLLYLKGGLALAEIKVDAGDVEGGLVDASDATSDDDFQIGYTVGGGVEYAFDETWTFKVEYLFADFEDTDTSNIDGDSFKHQHEIHSIKFGMNHKF